MPLPFRKHIRILLRNESKTDLISYTDLQWKRLDVLPDDVGCLLANYGRGTLRIPEEQAEICSVTGKGTIKAHWLALGCDELAAKNGEYICEGNQEFYIDGENQPSLEYLGTEDVYGHSWGLGEVGGDHYASIIRMDHPKPERTEIAMLRCRTEDSISFERDFKAILNYKYEYFSRNSKNPLHNQGVFKDRPRLSFHIDYQSCFYFYAEMK